MKFVHLKKPITYASTGAVLFCSVCGERLSDCDGIMLNPSPSMICMPKAIPPSDEPPNERHEMKFVFSPLSANSVTASTSTSLSLMTP